MPCQYSAGGRPAVADGGLAYQSTRSRQGGRLACQVAALQDLKIQVAEVVFGVKRWECTVRYRRYPVVKNDRLIGLISRRDVMHVLDELW